jgi:hypothetical protein
MKKPSSLGSPVRGRRKAGRQRTSRICCQRSGVISSRADFRYQLTSIGGSAQVYVAQEIENNRFRIAGGRPGLKVSWQVTGVRHDSWAQQHPLQVEEEKAPKDQGRYLHPRELGRP